jgi:hypothetical protein
MRDDRFKDEPLLDIASYGRQWQFHFKPLTKEQIAHVARTVRRSPEVMVKVLTQGGKNLKAVQAHVAYLSRDGDLAIETDEGKQVVGKDAERAMLEDWGLDLHEMMPNLHRKVPGNYAAPRLVHKLVFSMPPGTPAQGVLGAVRDFAREEFALMNRYAMVLHTDEEHPHVHLVVQAHGQDGKRLNIRKATLRRWRSDFAQQLRTRGIDANATERAVRGQRKSALKDPIYRSAQRGESTYLLGIEHGKPRAPVNRDNTLSSKKYLATEDAVKWGWINLRDSLRSGGYRDLAYEVTDFIGSQFPRRDLDWTKVREREKDGPER